MSGLWVLVDQEGLARQWSSSAGGPDWIEIDASLDPLQIRVVGGQVEVLPIEDRSPSDALADAKERALARVNRAVAETRAQYITALPGQDMIYLAKEAEARSWLAAVTPDLADYPLLAAETGLTAPTPGDLAQVWLNLAAIWRAAAARLEVVRLSAPASIAASPDADAAFAVAAAIIEDLSDG